MTPFKFPPPPPPPPKATSNDAQDQYSSQRGRENTRGGRGQGWQGRGRGGYRGNSRGGHGNAPSGGSRGGGYQHGGRSGYQQHTPQGQAQSFPSQLPTQQQSYAQNTASGTYVNTPSPIATQQYGAQAQPPVDPVAFAQAMAYMATPAGMQTFSAFASHISNGQQAPYAPQPQTQPPPQNAQSPQSNNKRKRGEHVPERRASHGFISAQTGPPKTKPPKAKAAPPPAIPSFGFSLPSVQASSHTKPTHNANQKKRKIQLGLTSREEEAQESNDEEGIGEEDVDEEAALASTSLVEGMSFEHNGQQISLQTPAEIAAWIKDRKKQYPTRKRAEEKAQEAAERRAHELEFLRKVKGKGRGGDVAQRQQGATNVPSNTSKEASTEKSRVALGELRAKVQESISAKRKASNASEAPVVKPQAVDLGLGYDSDSASESGDSILDEESSVVSSSDESSDDSDSDSDSPPEAQSSKVAAPPIVVPPPAPPPTLPKPKQKFENRTCSAWLKYGNCKHGDRCRHAHPPREEKKPMGLYDRLVEQEKEKADRLALDAIKWLGQNGFLG